MKKEEVYTGKEELVGGHGACGFWRGTRALPEDGLVLALGAEVAGEALAEAGGVVADTTARAVTSLLVTVTQEHIGAGGALLEGAVRSAVAHVAHASHMLHGVPRAGVGLGGLVCELLLGVADTA